ncbi:MAG: phenylacetic acid degradation protein [Methylocystaceae bacterium]|nr:MAG: phenylacetic acid degradation protein [Methylocystaceae bacterium]
MPQTPFEGALSPNALHSLSGLEIVRGMRDGRLPVPPLVLQFGFRPAEVEAGRVVFSATPDARHYNPLGTVHGGYIATLLDTAMGCAVHSKLAAGHAYTTLEFKVNFTRAITTATGEVRAEGKLLHLSRNIATAEARLCDESERLLAHATTTCLIFSAARPRTAPPA